MKYFFEDQQKQIELKRVLDEWRGTPFRHWAGVKNQGCDCIHFVTKVFEELGLGPFKIPRYNKDWHLHNMDELLLDGIVSQLLYDDVGFDSPLNGDLMLFKFGKTNSHSAIYYDDHLYQSINDIGVERIHWMDNRWHKRKRFCFRILT